MCPGHLSALRSLPVGVHVVLKCSVVTLVLLVHACACSRRAGVFCDHFIALGSLPMDVHVGLKCAVVTFVLLVHCLWVFT